MTKLPAIFFTLLILFAANGLYAQSSVNDTITVEAIIYNGDTIEMKTLEPVGLYARMTDAQRKAWAAYNRLRNAVYVTYPFARRAGMVMNDINFKLATLLNADDRRKYIRSREKELKKEFTDPLTNLSVYQGKVLMKLINRETGNNCYEIIKEYKGSGTARVYQTVAFFFNSDLKQPYEPGKADKTIEHFVVEVQRMYGYTDIRKMAVSTNNTAGSATAHVQ